MFVLLGTKALGEEVLQGAEQVYIWRLRIPFDHRDNPRNYLSKLINYKTLLEAENSSSHLGEFAAAACACWEKKLPFGIYILTNPGAITTLQVTDLIRTHLLPGKKFESAARGKNPIRYANNGALHWAVGFFMRRRGKGGGGA